MRNCVIFKLKKNSKNPGCAWSKTANTFSPVETSPKRKYEYERLLKGLANSWNIAIKCGEVSNVKN